MVTENEQTLIAKIGALARAIGTDISELREDIDLVAAFEDELTRVRKERESQSGEPDDNGEVPVNDTVLTEEQA